MLGLPKSAEFNRRIPKQKFYEKLPVTSALKRVFIDQIKTIYWRHKIAATTMNLAAGDAVKEIEVFEIQLTAPSLDVTVLKQIDKEIPYPLLFLLEYEGKYQAWIAYKEFTASGAFKVGTYFHTNWLQESELPLKVEGLNTDTVYENFVRQTAGEDLRFVRAGSLKEAVERYDRIQDLQKRITALQAKIRKEKQLNKIMRLYQDYKKLMKELEEL